MKRRNLPVLVLAILGSACVGAGATRATFDRDCRAKGELSTGSAFAKGTTAGQSIGETWKTILALEEQGRIDRAVAALDAAESAHPQHVSPLRWRRAFWLAELGKVAEAEALAGELMSKESAGGGARLPRAAALEAIRRNRPTPLGKDAPTSMRLMEEAAEARLNGEAVHAQRLYEEAWQGRHPWAEASLGAGLAAIAAGEPARGQRLLDRSLAEFAEAAGADAWLSVVDSWSLGYGRESALSLDGKLIAMQGRVPGISIFEARTGRYVRGFSGSPAFAFDRTSRRLAFRLDDDLVVVHPLTGQVFETYVGAFWEASVPQQLRTDESPVRWAVSRMAVPIVFSPNDQRIAIGGLLPGIASRGSGRIQRLSGSKLKWVSAVAWSRDGRLMALGDAQGVVGVWDPSRGALIRQDKSHSGPVDALQFVDGDRQLVSAALGDVIYMKRSLATGQILRRHTVPDGASSRASAVSADGARVATVSAGGLELYRVEGGHREMITEFPGSNEGRLYFSPCDDKILLNHCRWQGLCAFDTSARTASGSPSFQVVAGHSFALADSVWVDAKSDRLVFDHEDQLLRKWNWRKNSLSAQRYASDSSLADRMGQSASNGSDFAVDVWLNSEGTYPQVIATRENLLINGSRRSTVIEDMAREPPARHADLTVNKDPYNMPPYVLYSRVKVSLLALNGTATGVVIRNVERGLSSTFDSDSSYDILGPDQAQAESALRCSLTTPGTESGDLQVFPIEICRDRLREVGLLTKAFRDAGLAARARE